ncbi:MAG: hypothetical protein ABIG42_11630 [bacterium]
MKYLRILITPVFLLITLLPIVSAQDSSDPGTTIKPTGTYFEVEISSPGKSSVLWKNWRDNGMYYGEAEIGGSKSMIIIRDGYSISLSPDIKVAKKSRLEMNTSKNPLASKYGSLADIPQIDPGTYISTARMLNAQLQGPTMIENNTKAELYTLKITEKTNFPWNDFMIWVDPATKLPIKLKYSEGTDNRTLTFKNIEQSKKIDQSRFEIPEGYKVIIFEWD